MKNSSDTIGNPARDLPACSAVPQPSAQPRTPQTKRRFHRSEDSTNLHRCKSIKMYLNILRKE